MLVLSLVWRVKKLSKHTLLMAESLRSESGEAALRTGLKEKKLETLSIFALSNTV